MTLEKRCFIGLGSNLGNPPQQIRDACAALGAIPALTGLSGSPLYTSKPMGPPDQPDYVNAVVACCTLLEAEALLDVLQSIEQAQGRERTGPRWGARTLDLDLLTYGDSQIDSPRLRVPHPGIAERAFVLLPWADIAPGFLIPGLGRVGELARRFPAGAVSRLDERAN